jgi:hypothetical protein
MPNTLTHNISYPLGTVAPNVPVVMQALAESVDAAITAVSKLKHAEFTSTTASQAAGAGVNFGSLTADAAKTVNNSFCTADTTGKVTFNEVGTYVAYAKVSPTAAYTALQLWAFDGAGVQQLAQPGTGYGGQPVTGVCTIYVDTPGQTLQFGATYNVAATSNTRVRITKIRS